MVLLTGSLYSYLLAEEIFLQKNGSTRETEIDKLVIYVGVDKISVKNDRDRSGQFRRIQFTGVRIQIFYSSRFLINLPVFTCFYYLLMWVLTSEEI